MLSVLAALRSVMEAAAILQRGLVHGPLGPHQLLEVLNVHVMGFGLKNTYFHRSCTLEQSLRELNEEHIFFTAPSVRSAAV